MLIHRTILFSCVVAGLLVCPAFAVEPPGFFATHCVECHSPPANQGGLDLTALPRDFAQPEAFARWVKIHDRIQAGEMPPKTEARPPAEELQKITGWLQESLTTADRVRLQAAGKTAVGG